MDDKKEINTSITMKDLFIVIKMNWLIILLTTVVITGLGSLYGFVLTKDMYTASSSVIITSQETLSTSQETTSFSESLLATNTIKEFMSNEVVISAVADEILMIEDYSEYKYQDIKNIIRDGLTISNSNQSLIINVTFSTKSTKILNQHKEKFVVDVANKVVKKSIEILNEKHETDDDSYKYGTQLANRVQELSLASICQVSRNSFKITIICFALGLVLGYGVSFVKYITVDYKRLHTLDTKEQE